ncbi:hypothetical protein [Tenacibaculum sp. M341]|uniref:hypothetical protein n=1 Tax=Tenacibaculum sp. M341 TaxID=2530339 RepID=UPI00104FB195|nr:hypothetical protein [Tenacibaculum sp. M341]TCI90750.1 hypothetical protein EYW44_13595 [Tenacibaculum sp. M341]
MKILKLLFLLLIIISCSSSRDIKLSECLEKKEAELLYEGKNVFEETLIEFYAKESLEDCYMSYFKDLTLATDNLFLLESKSKGIDFIKKLKSLNKIKTFWKKTEVYEDEEQYFPKKGKYLSCLIKLAKTERFKEFLTMLNKDVSVYVPTLAGSLYGERGRETLRKENEVLRIYIAFHFYYASILNNELKEVKKTI